MEETKRRFEGKKVYIKTTSGRNYTGEILNEDSNFIYLKDKFGNSVALAVNTIELIEEVRG